MKQREFVVAFPRLAVAGTVIRRVRARSESEIVERVPGAEVWDPPPQWVTEEHLARLRTGPAWDIDEPLDLHMMTQPPGLVFHRDDPPPGAKVIRDPDALAKARKMFRERS